MLRRLQPVAGALALAMAPCLSQDDLRDRVTRRDGRELLGRVCNPFDADALVLAQGGKRVRLPRAEVRALDTVAARVQSFCDRRLRLQASPRAQQFLVDWARQQGLPGLARLQALWCVLQDDDDAAAHEFLGHTRGPKGWLWEHEGRRMSREQLELAMAKAPLRLVGERFALRSDAGLQASVAALLDLEHLAVVWYERFGADLGLREVLAPIEIVTWRNGEQFPKWGFRPVPYYVPAPHGDVVRTFYAGPAPQRPELLFFAGTQALIYHTLAGEVSRTDERDRVCAWLEIGLGMWMQRTMQGPAGFAAPAPHQGLDVQAYQALGRGYRLTHLLHLPMYPAFYLTDDTATAVNWSAAATFVAWLLLPDNQPATREPFLAFVRAALGDRKGDSSSAFDRLMGRPVEDLDAPWRAWLAKQAGY